MCPVTDSIALASTDYVPAHQGRRTTDLSPVAPAFRSGPACRRRRHSPCLARTGWLSRRCPRVLQSRPQGSPGPQCCLGRLGGRSGISFARLDAAGARGRSRAPRCVAAAAVGNRGDDRGVRTGSRPRRRRVGPLGFSSPLGFVVFGSLQSSPDNDLQQRILRLVAEALQVLENALLVRAQSNQEHGCDYAITRRGGDVGARRDREHPDRNDHL
jgi:hypothetical protein